MCPTRHRLSAVAAGAGLSLVLVPAAGATVTVTAASGPANENPASNPVLIEYDTPAQLRITRANPANASGAIVIEAIPGTPDPGFFVEPGCVRESARRVVCSGLPNRPAGTVRLEAKFGRLPDGSFASAATDDRIVVGPGVQPPVPGVVSRLGRGRDSFDLREAVGTIPSGIAVLANRWSVEGNDGDDVLRGSSGSDLLDGGNGNDVLAPREEGPAPPGLSGSFVDDLRGGLGRDLVDFGANAPAATPVIRTVPSNTAPSVEGFIGTSGRDRLTGNGQDNVLIGEAGDDRLDGGDGRDEIFGGDGDDGIDGGVGDDLLLGDGDADRINGGDGNDRIGGFTDFEQATPTSFVCPPGTSDLLCQRLRQNVADQNDAPEEDGIDRLDGDAGGDTIKAQADGKVDSVKCGANGASSGTVSFGGLRVIRFFALTDRVIADLVDNASADCENVERSDRSERGMVSLTPLRARGGVLRVRLACGRGALTRCRGRVALTTAAGSTVRGGVPYDLRRGRSKTVALRAARRGGARAGGKLRLRAVEAGKRRPRTAEFALSGGSR